MPHCFLFLEEKLIRNIKLFYVFNVKAKISVGSWCFPDNDIVFLSEIWFYQIWTIATLKHIWNDIRDKERFSLSRILQFKRKSYTQAPICFSLLTPLPNTCERENYSSIYRETISYWPSSEILIDYWWFKT